MNLSAVQVECCSSPPEIAIGLGMSTVAVVLPAFGAKFS